MSAELLAGLSDPAAYPHAVRDVELIETHISWVFLTGDWVYKINKPVDLGFLDFSTLEKRHAVCENELRLNRHWAPSLYVDVVPVVNDGGRLRVAADGTPVEYALRMRQFEQAMRLDHQFETGALGDDDMLELAAHIAERHLAARRAGPAERAYREARELIIENYDALEGAVPPAFLAAQRNWMDAKLAAHEPLMRQRCADGYVRDCHGDLHLGNIVRLADGIRAYDCIAFNRKLREIDVVADYAFLAMDLRARGAARLGAVFVNRYLEVTGDYAGACLLPLYEVYRSLVRAKIHAIRQRERRVSAKDSDQREIRHYCALARLVARRRQPLLVAMSGYSGSGKTWLSSRLIPELGAIRMRSDLERKRRAGLGPTEDSHSGVGIGLYDAATTDALYDDLLEAARRLLCAGLDVIVDAAFLRAGQRARARQAAADAGAALVLVRATADEAVLRRRLRQRGAGGADVSEADTAVLNYQLETADAPGTEDRAAMIDVDTDGPVDPVEVALAVRRIGRSSA